MCPISSFFVDLVIGEVMEAASDQNVNVEMVSRKLLCGVNYTNSASYVQYVPYRLVSSVFHLAYGLHIQSVKCCYRIGRP